MFNLLKKYQFFWDLNYLLARFLPYSAFKKIPKEIIIELTNACNLRCPVCPTHFAMKREKGFMEFKLFKSIIDEFLNKTIKPRISMNFAGEPLLHPEVDKFVSYAIQNNHQVFISTNATLLTKDLSKRLIEAGLSSIHLCIDGATKQSHEAYRIGSSFEIVKENIENFLLIKKELKRKNPIVFIQTLLTSFSEKEVDEIINWAKKIGADGINLKSLSLGSYTTKEMRKKYSYLLPTKKEFKRKTSNLRKRICLTPLRQAVIYWNGDLGLCCIDFDNIFKLPNIKKEGFINTFFSGEVIKARKNGVLRKSTLCKRCALRDADFMGIDINFKK